MDRSVVDWVLEGARLDAGEGSTDTPDMLGVHLWLRFIA